MGRDTKTFVLAYAPTKEDEYQGFLASLDLTLMTLEGKGQLTLMGDFNGQVGNNREVWGDVLGPYGVPVDNVNGRSLLTFFSNRGVCILNTYFKQRNSRKYTWHTTKETVKGAGRTLIDLFVCSVNHRRSWTNVRSYTTTQYKSDHRLVVATLQIDPRQIKQTKTKKVTRMRYEELQDKRKRKTVEERMEASFQKQLVKTVRTIETDWEKFRTSLLSTCAEVCGTTTKVTSGNHPHTMVDRGSEENSQAKKRMQTKT